MNSQTVKDIEAQLVEARKAQLFCVYLSPGSYFSEESRIEITDKNLALCAMAAKGIEERHGATPYAFRFEDGNRRRLSGLHFITGRVIRYEDVPDDREHRIMRSNMRTNNPVVVENTNSYKFTGEFGEQDVIVDWSGNVTARGDDPELVAYRKNFDWRNAS